MEWGSGASGRKAGVSSWVFLSGLQESRYNSRNYFLQARGEATESQKGFSAKLGQRCTVSPSQELLSVIGTENIHLQNLQLFIWHQESETL